MARFYLVGGLTTLLLLLPHPGSLNIAFMLVIGGVAPFVALGVP
jgi:hypothetical protein